MRWRHCAYEEKELRIYAEPSVKSKIVGKLAVGEEARIVGERSAEEAEHQWRRVETDHGKRGWMLEKIHWHTVDADDYTELYAEASLKSKVVGKLVKGDEWRYVNFVKDVAVDSPALGPDENSQAAAAKTRSRDRGWGWQYASTRWVLIETKDGKRGWKLEDLWRVIDRKQAYKRSLQEYAQGNVEIAVTDYLYAAEESDLESDDKFVLPEPKSASEFTLHGVVKMYEGKLAKALSDFESAIKLDPKFARAYVNRGLVKKSRGDLDGAIAGYNRAIELYSRSQSCDRTQPARRTLLP